MIFHHEDKFSCSISALNGRFARWCVWLAAEFLGDRTFVTLIWYCASYLRVRLFSGFSLDFLKILYVRPIFRRVLSADFYGKRMSKLFFSYYLFIYSTCFCKRSSWFLIIYLKTSMLPFVSYLCFMSRKCRGSGDGGSEECFQVRLQTEQGNCAN